LQPELYWSGSASPFSVNGNGYLSFSFANGWQNSDLGVNPTDPHNPNFVTSVAGLFLNVLPMYPGQLPGSPPPTGTGLQVSGDGRSVYDPILNVTWPTDANLAATDTFGLPRCIGVGHTGLNGAPPCVADEGTMNWTSANLFVQGMRDANYLGGSNWQLPPIIQQGCMLDACANADDPMAYLFYERLGFLPGDTVDLSTLTTGSFSDLQPYFYWSCVASSNVDPVVSGCSGSPASPELEFDYSFESGFLNTDLETTYNFVIPYYVDTPEPSTGIILLSGTGALYAALRRRHWLFPPSARLALREHVTATTVWITAGPA